MASLRQRRAPCIRAALSATWAGTSTFRKRQRNVRHHLQGHIRPLGAGYRVASVPSPGGHLCPPLLAARWQRAAAQPLTQAAHRRSLVDLAEAFWRELSDPDNGDSETPGPAGSLADCLLCARPQGTKSEGPGEAGTRVLEVDTSDVYMQPAGRARGTRPSPRLRGERKGPKCSLSKRKLELLLVEPENSKRKKYYAA